MLALGVHTYVWMCVRACMRACVRVCLYITNKIWHSTTEVKFLRCNKANNVFLIRPQISFNDLHSVFPDIKQPASDGLNRRRKQLQIAPVNYPSATRYSRRSSTNWWQSHVGATSTRPNENRSFNIPFERVLWALVRHHSSPTHRSPVFPPSAITLPPA